MAKAINLKKRRRKKKERKNEGGRDLVTRF
jgi:hypothetical protein